MNEKKAGQFDLQDRLVEFSVRVIAVVEALPNDRTGNHIAGQLLRSGTSPLANHAEAQSAESRRDFVHKMKVALKELRETRAWLLVIERKPLISNPAKMTDILAESNELISIFVASIRTAEDNM
ncbi:MAG: four helix bundle protein [Pirellulales bacterium]|nr:four helix bundle protein [Pirellulales bacterium]